ncbi:MAG: hypothetical protein LPH21_00025 [Shewanella sp.]|nr:hypothetical protein [Shewanella sp.]
MNGFGPFFLEAYWWLSLLGGIHCLLLSLYIRYIYQESQDNHKLLAGIFAMLSLNFFTGLINHQNSPAPLHLLFVLIIPVYFLLMPMLYIYCKRGLTREDIDVRYSPHYVPALLIWLVAVVTVTWDWYHVSTGWQLAFDTMGRLEHLGIVGTLLPALLSIQTYIYFVLLIKMLQKHKGHGYRASDSLKGIKFRWLLALTITMLGNWIIRMFLLIQPFYLGGRSHRWKRRCQDCSCC